MRGVSVDTHRAAAGRTTPPLPNSLGGPACSPATLGIPAPGQSCRGLSASAGRARPDSPIAPWLGPCPKGPRGRPIERGDLGLGARSACPWRPRSAPVLTCSVLCGSSGACHQPGRRRTGSRRRCLQLAGSRWWSPHGSAGPVVVAAAAGAAEARGGSSRRRRWWAALRTLPGT